jgi:hypothetical protein
MKRIIFTGILIFGFCFKSFAQTEIKEQVTDNLNFPQTVFNKEIKSLTGKSFRLSDSKTKFIVILFWTHWAIPSISALDELNKGKAIFDKKDVEVFGLIPVSKYFESNYVLTEDIRNSSELIRMFNVKFSNGFLEDEELLKILDLKALPQVWIIMNDGKVLEKFIGYKRKETFNLLNKAIDNNSKNK